MTIEKGVAWGREVPRPDDLLVVHDDRGVAAALSGPSPHRPVAPAGGDLARTLGTSGPGDRQRLNEFPLDLVEVYLDGDTGGDAVVACAHVLARSPRSRGSWWRGPALAVMNAEFVGSHDVAPRGHPNDGRVETFLVDDAMLVRQRIAAQRRLATGTHVPHPSISTRSVRSANWLFDTDLEVFIDGVRVGRTRSIAVVVRPDAALIYA